MIRVEGFSSSGKQKAADYMKVLNDLSLTQEGHRLCGKEWIFQQDNAAIHKASITKKYLLEQKIRLLVHPACSPDVNPIEHLWGLIVVKVYEEGQQYSAISEVKNTILDAWGKIPSIQLQKLVHGMSSQIFEVIKYNGGSTKYWIKHLHLYSIVLPISLIFMSKQNFKIKQKC